jgi:hypothetical protein
MRPFPAADRVALFKSALPALGSTRLRGPRGDSAPRRARALQATLSAAATRPTGATSWARRPRGARRRESPAAAAVAACQAALSTSYLSVFRTREGLRSACNGVSDGMPPGAARRSTLSCCGAVGPCVLASAPLWLQRPAQCVVALREHAGDASLRRRIRPPCTWTGPVAVNASFSRLGEGRPFQVGASGARFHPVPRIEGRLGPRRGRALEAPVCSPAPGPLEPGRGRGGHEGLDGRLEHAGDAAHRRRIRPPAPPSRACTRPRLGRCVRTSFQGVPRGRTLQEGLTAAASRSAGATSLARR